MQTVASGADYVVVVQPLCVLRGGVGVGCVDLSDREPKTDLGRNEDNTHTG